MAAANEEKTPEIPGQMQRDRSGLKRDAVKFPIAQGKKAQ